MKSSLQHPSASPSDFAGFSQKTFDAIQPKVYRPQSATINDSPPALDSLAPSERQVFEVISHITGLRSSHLSPDMTIHQLGVDSIGAIQLASKLRSAFGVEITAADILEKPRISDIALMTEQRDGQPENTDSFDFQEFERQHKSSTCQELALSIDDVESILPCTPLQMGIVSQFMRSESTYVNYVTYEMDSTWTAARLEAAWKTVSELHIMLRTGFVSLEDPLVSFAMVSYYMHSFKAPIEVSQQKDLSESDINQWRMRSTNYFHENLSQPPWAILIVENGSGVCMHIAMLHALYDAQSLSIILGDLASAQTSVQQFVPAAIHPMLGHILNSSILTKDQEVTDKRMQYWKDIFANASINKFPNLQPLHFSTGKTEVQTRKGLKTVQELELLCRKAGVSLQAVGQAAWAQLLSALIGEHNVTFGVVLSGRGAVMHSSRVAFPCLTTVPLAVEVPNTNRELLDDMMKFNASIRRQQFTPMKDIQRWVERPNEGLFDTIFAFQKLSKPAQKMSWKVVDEVATSEVCVSPIEVKLANYFQVRNFPGNRNRTR